MLLGLSYSALRCLRSGTGPPTHPPSLPPTHPPTHLHRYGASYWRLFRANFLRSWRLQLRSKLFMYVRVFQICLMGFVVATCYINVGKNTLDDGERLGRWPPCLVWFFRGGGGGGDRGQGRGGEGGMGWQRWCTRIHRLGVERLGSSRSGVVRAAAGCRV